MIHLQMDDGLGLAFWGTSVNVDNISSAKFLILGGNVGVSTNETATHGKLPKSNWFVPT